MNNLKKFAACGVLLAFLLITSCDWDHKISEHKSFDSDLRGTWVSNDPSTYSGSLEITFDTITIKGFTKNQTPSGEDDNKRPFKNFTRGAALKGYSEDGKLFIEDAGLLQEIPYKYYLDAHNNKFLRFNFGGEPEIMQRQWL